MPALLDHDSYTIAWIAVLPIEAKAALLALNQVHEGNFPTVRGDDYLYIGGELNGHNVVVATLPVSQSYGVGSAAALVNQVKLRFANIWFALLVGVAAGLPNLESREPNLHRDIRLGDVLVCVPDNESTGVIHYDLGRDTTDGFRINGRQAEPSTLVRSAIRIIELTKDKAFRKGGAFAQYLDDLYEKDADHIFACPPQQEDLLYRTLGDARHSSELVSREPRDENERTKVWYGRIGSGNSVMRNSYRRDQLRDEFDLIGLEMEAAGVMNALPTGVIRGVCDYGDDRKTKRWQPYAAAVAAVYAKGILCTISPKQKQSQAPPQST